AILPLRVIAVFESVALFSCGAMINKNASRCETYRRFLKRFYAWLRNGDFIENRESGAGIKKA
ncbi:MAG: hypothetical protein ACLQVW_07700, partial [Limisphaerales bacterium]